MKRIEKHIIKELRHGRFKLTLHALQRMNERHVLEADIIHVARYFQFIHYQPNKNTYLIKGKSEWGDKLYVSAAMREEVIIVTVFFEEEL